MPNSNNKDKSPINYSASHDQASLKTEIDSIHKELPKIQRDFEKIQENQLPINSKTLPEEWQEQLNKINIEASNLLDYAGQKLNDIQEAAKKLSTFQQHSPYEKLKYAESLLATHNPLTANEKFRFKEIEEALSNTCIIKSAGDETIKFQLGILGYANDSNIISESEFNYLVVARLKENNLLDAHRLRVEKGMILKQTSLEICQSINESLSSDPDYEDSKNLFVSRLKGIDYELNLKILENIDRECRDLTLLRKELMSLSFQNSDDSFEENSFEEKLSFPGVPTHPIEFNSQQPFNEPTINHIKEYQKKSEFVSLIQELIPEKKKNVIHIDTVQPMSLETIMQASLEESSSLSKNEIFKLNYQTSSKIKDAALLAVHNHEEQFRKSYSTDGSSTYEEMKRSCEAAFKNHDEKLKKTVSCKLTGEPLVKGYYEFGNKYLSKKIEDYKTAIETLENNKSKKFGEFSKYNAKYANLTEFERKTTLNRIYDDKKTKFNRELENAEKQRALWLGKKTFTQSIEKNGKIKQEEIPFPEKELRFRNLVLDFNSNSTSEGKTIKVYLDGVYLVSDKKTEPSTSIQISNTRASYKNGIRGQTASIFYSPNKKGNYTQLAVGMSPLRS
jgi:hypothetical protein